MKLFLPPPGLAIEDVARRHPIGAKAAIFQPLRHTVSIVTCADRYNERSLPPSPHTHHLMRIELVAVPKMHAPWFKIAPQIESVPRGARQTFETRLPAARSRRCTLAPFPRERSHRAGGDM